MFGSAKRARDRSRSSQRPSIDVHPERASQIPEPANPTTAGTKRLFSNRHSRLSHGGGGGENEEPDDVPAEVHSEKRHRSGNWPLLNSSPVETASRAPLRHRDVPNSPTLRATAAGAQKRPSKFLEGSMNDRVSQKPPVPYLGADEEFLADYSADEREFSDRGGKTRPQSYLPNSNASTTGLSDASRHSGILRFGKTIAATFNPSNWKLFKSQTGQEDGEAAQQRILRERQAKAEAIYAELKQSGHFPNIRTQSFDAFADGKSFNKHDSGIAFAEDPRMSADSRAERDEKRKGMVFLEPAAFPENRPRGESPASVAGSAAVSRGSTPSKSMMGFKKASLSNIKKSFARDGSSMDHPSTGGEHHQARRTPSRKDLQKQQRLVKRVSDLEGKLEAARRQLNEALAEPLPAPGYGQERVRRPRFVPGAMPSLLSERLLSGYLPSEDDEEDAEIGMALPFGPYDGNSEEARGRSRPEQTQNSLKIDQTSAPTDNGVFVPGPGQGLNARPEADIKSGNGNSSMYTTEYSGMRSPSNYSTSVDQNQSQMDGSSEEDGSVSVIASSEPLVDEEITPKASRTSTIPNTANKQDTPKPRAANLITKKRKSLADDSDIPNSTPSEHESGAEYKPRTVLKRKAVGSPAKQTATAVVPLSPPTRAPPPPASSSTPQHSPSKSAKFTSTSSPSSPASRVTRGQNPPPPPTRKISRKAVPPSSSTSTSTSRLTKPKPVAAHNKTTVQQSVPQPPSSPVFTGVGDMKDTIVVNSGDEPNATPASVNHSKNGNAGTLTSPQPSTNLNSPIPPMPPLPKTVLMPNGEVVEVDNFKNGPIPPPRNRVLRPRKELSAAEKEEKVEQLRGMVAAYEQRHKDECIAEEEATRARRAEARAQAQAGKVGKPVKKSKGKRKRKDEEEDEEDEGEDEKKKSTSSASMNRSDTKASFEWPPDCF